MTVNLVFVRIAVSALCHCFQKRLSEKAVVSSSVAALISCFCFIIEAAVIVLWLGVLFLLSVLLYSQRVASHSCETIRQLLHRPSVEEF